jgi:hypothetical protein
MSTFDLFAPAPAAVSLEESIRRQIAREFARNPALSVPKPGHPEFVGPHRPFSMRDFFDPRVNVPGRTYWGD